MNERKNEQSDGFVELKAKIKKSKSVIMPGLSVRANNHKRNTTSASTVKLLDL